ncbi:craniofacial development protein 1 isoform X1 [Pangasianodon hypophthalmus]|uniref:craniofacial development protein 1 isoform X1 n=1 Tax=Pangasianodon hypophthalmus TaxID=310915 RepID=UPI000EFE00ED|nr:craniofacial development protein 1 isoform X1 [Pangasianodon hypophthalmus]
MMNYSDYDSEDYSSNEDEDYVPSDDNLSEDDLNECEKEDGLDAEDQSEAPREQVKKKKKSSKGLSARKRKKGGLKLEGGEEGGTDKQKEEEVKLLDEKTVEEEPTKGKEEQQQRKADDLWASFLSDVGPRPKAEAPGSHQTTAGSDKVSKPSTESPHKEPKATGASRITITKVYDFAGEEVRVTKEVDADSREAKSFLKKEENEEKEEEQQTSMSKASASSSLTAGPSVKRPAGMGSVLSRIGAKKPKMSTLEKSKLDWDSFKAEEGITEELAIHNRGKEGYVERKNFLERVDQRQFELEKNVRLSNMKP